jgi:hypothetical protein
MTIELQFDSAKNKSLIWNILQENGLFNHIDDKFVSQVKQELDITVQKSNKMFNPDLPLVERNKIVISKFVTNLEKYKQNTSKQQNSSIKPHINLVYSQQDLQKKRQSEFDNQLSQQQNNFDKMINKDKPKSVDFSDKKDEPIGDEMDKLLEAAMAERNLQLDTVVSSNPSPQEANKWLSQNSDLTPNSSKDNVPPKLKIENNDVSNDEKPKKTVRFSESNDHSNVEEENMSDFFGKLKSVNQKQESNEGNSEQIINLLNQIIHNQEEIMNKLDIKK